MASLNRDGGAVDGLLARLVGLRLNQVVFVMDYVQLCFDGTSDAPVLSYYVWPVVKLPTGSYRESDLGYADALRSLITHIVVTATETRGEGVVLRFLDGATVVANPSLDELVGAEIAALQGFDDQQWMVWRPGEEIFADLR